MSLCIFFRILICGFIKQKLLFRVYCIAGIFTGEKFHTKDSWGFRRNFGLLFSFAPCCKPHLSPHPSLTQPWHFFLVWGNGARLPIAAFCSAVKLAYFPLVFEELVVIVLLTMLTASFATFIVEGLSIRILQQWQCSL